jgi:hypothetical protein
VESKSPVVRPLLVCSVYAGGQYDGFWLELQRRQLRTTVGEGGFEHAVYLGHRGEEGLFSGSVVVGRAQEGNPNEHLAGLQCLAGYAQSNQDRYSGFLVLDSDAFPIAPGWIALLNCRLEKFKKPCAAAVRTENLDAFPHPCVVYSRQAESLRFSLRDTVSLLGHPVRDIGCDGERWLPLLKSNWMNVHPVLSTVYSGLFYHHGCGSRNFRMRSTLAGYYDDVLKTAPSADALFEALRRSPAAFLAALNEPISVPFAEPASEPPPATERRANVSC